MSRDDDASKTEATGTSVSGHLLFSTSMTAFTLDTDVYDPTQNLSDEELETLMKDCKQALKTVLTKRFPKIEPTGRVI